MTEVDLLFFGAHPDDIELGCGGTIVKAVKDGLRVGMVDLTRGEMGTRGTPKTRKREAAASARILGASFREQLDFSDGALRTGRDEELQIIDIVRRTRPKIVFAMYPDDRHPDHTRTGRIVTEASFYAGLRALETGVEAHRPHTVVYYVQNYMVPPSFVVDCTKTWKTKMRAIAAFKSQFHDPKSKEPQTFISDPKFLAMIDARGIHFGALIGSAYGEAFVTKQPPRIDDVINAYGGREV
ncbi:MAG: N-acetylglucosamine malate deacetylase 1 [Acidobacteriota bacterium]|jgi:bacillithiol biosynthesis deacetylase BshB1|nr:N-acetylglucosamine malate deacetylase 1 [Acidobacteriota bacterium]